jgi:putative protease
VITRLKREKNKPEILAPAGNEAGIIAAINAGADAVYFGGKICNARQRAANLDEKAIRHSVRLCHQHGVRAYLTLNILVKDSEWDELIDYLCFLETSGIDGLIVQDPGLIWVLRKYYPQIKLQTSTQASVGGLFGVLFFEGMGFTRVVLPREMPIAEVQDIKKHSRVELKVFAHGALCFARSGQCLMSSLIGGRSGNRGLCAQPCRQYYRLTDAQGKLVREGYLLSMKDLDTRAHLKEIADAGVSALKIEGRLKNQAYIYATTKAYAQAPEDGTQAPINLDAIFSRDFTAGWLFDPHHHINAQVQKKRGALIGEVEKTGRGEMVVALKKGVTLAAGDGLAFGEAADHGMRVEKVQKIRGQGNRVRVFGHVTARPHEPVYRNKDSRMLAAIASAAERPVYFTPLALSIDLDLKKDQPIHYRARADERQIEGRMAIAPSQAHKHPLDQKTVQDQLQKLGGTDYFLADLHVKMADDLFLSKKDLNRVRREIIEQLDAPGKRRIDLPALWSTPGKIRDGRPPISLEVRKLDQIATLRACRPDEWVLPLDGVKSLPHLRRWVQKLKKENAAVRIAFPPIMNTQRCRSLAAHLNEIEAMAPDGYLARNYETLYLLRQTRRPIEADASLHVFSAMTTKALDAWGCASAVISHELEAPAIQSLLKRSALPLVLSVYGFQAVMHSDNCAVDCDEKQCSRCPHRGLYFLKDRLGKAFPMALNEQGKTVIYNADKLFLTPEMLKPLKGIDRYRIHVMNETTTEISRVMAIYRSGRMMNLEPLGEGQHFTAGNFKRGVQ